MRGADGAPGRELFRSCRDRALRYLAPADPQLDFPVAGMVLFGLGAWGLLRGAAPADDAVRLLVARRPVRLQPHDPDDGVGADRPERRGARPGPDRGVARPTTATAGRTTCSTRRAALIEQLTA